MVVIHKRQGSVVGANRACKGQIVSGDCLFMCDTDDGIIVGIADGLGHGALAHDISSRVKQCMESSGANTIVDMLYEADQFISPSGGAAVGVAEINYTNYEVSFAAVGNIGACIIGSKDKSFVFKDGMVGARMRTPLLQKEKLKSGDKLLLFSDGIQERFYASCNRTKFKSKPEIVMNMLMDEYGKDYDDASCWVVGI